MTAQVLLLMMIQLFADEHRLGATQSTLSVSHSSQNQHSVSLAGSGTKLSLHCLHGTITEALEGRCHCDWGNTSIASGAVLCVLARACQNAGAG